MTRPALVAISHGTSSLEGASAVRGLVKAVGARLMRGGGMLPGSAGHAASSAAALRLGHVDVEQPDVPATLASLPAGMPAVVVPLLLSAGYHVHVDLAEAVAAERSRTIGLAGALGPDDRLARVLVRRLIEAGWRAGDAVVLAAAGSSDARAVADCAQMGERLARELGASVAIGYLSAAEPTLEEAIRRAVGPNADPDADPAAARRVVVASYLLAPGYFQDLAVATAREAGAAAVTEPLLRAGALPPEELAELVVDRFAAAAARLSTM
ncbi:cobalamin biosynthesis protein CbiX [Agromyces mediolanus]|uniref:sirohydrochlorin chelatase n=1 Tax=Agromyces mediolanus TaxID=41986 RepID=UPI00203BCD97|nr:CbiX/SirB N-terminal domain-containing protein [Agromyces mediolanus]MCM3656447.1 cobalamin biosynthesis protein CbiX [Agromyces mediolanus]